MINVFDYRKHKPAIIDINERQRRKWDLEENVGFINGLTFGNIYKIRNENLNNERALYLLGYIEQYVNIIKKDMLMHEGYCHTKKCINESILFVITPFSLQEIPKNTKFEGINKPLFIVYSPKDGLVFKKDNKYRAGSRHIMLTLRNEDGSLKDWKHIKRLLLHELAHTMCNHVTYREAGNHEGDFKKCEKFLKLLTNKSEDIQSLEMEIIGKLF
jgi:hypothetical protein